MRRRVGQFGANDRRVPPAPSPTGHARRQCILNATRAVKQARGTRRGARCDAQAQNTSPASFSLPTSRESENVPCCVPDKRDIFDNFKMSRGTHKMSRIYGTFVFKKNVPRSQFECPAGHFVFFENVPAKKNVPKMSRFYGTFSGHFDILCPAGHFSFFW